jgi:C4-dicarboxylate-specific signal transduction histidine kinase
MYAFYVAYVLFFLMMNFTYSGYSFPYLWPDYPEWGNWAHSVSIYLYTLSGLFFAVVFLNTKEKLPRIHRGVLIYMAFVLGVFILSSLTGGYAHNVATSILFVVLFSIIAFALGIISWMHGNRTARFYILATTTGLFGAAITAFTVSSILPYNFFTYRAVDLGMILDAMLLSLALADRYKLLERERDRLRFKEEKHRELLKQKEAFTRELEDRVQEELEKNRRQEKVMLRQYQQAALGNMIGVIAHQLKQPLNAVGLYMQDMVESYKHGELTSSSVDKMQKNVWERILFMSRTIDDFRNYFRPGKEAKRFVLQDAIGKVVSLLDRQIETRDIAIDVIDTHPIAVVSHQNELEQVLLNLMTNAFDIFEEREIKEPKVTIDLKEEDGRAVITVEDNGGGIPGDALPHMFEIYYTTKGEAGTGLGLYMSKMIVTESLGGEITVENGKEGARFVINLLLT